ncbi:hypothetical protein LBMAG42_21080 [Deltaproteobacteria bacterium]|nr:hypothetical protein LBMAG42_21080 [Deltaproteobacteria bacterium]
MLPYRLRLKRIPPNFHLAIVLLLGSCDAQKADPVPASPPAAPGRPGPDPRAGSPGAPGAAGKRSFVADSKLPNLLLITVCSFRSDHIGAYGYSRATTPNLDAMALESAVFEGAWSNATHTGASHAALFSGLIPGHAGILDIGEPLRPDVMTLPEVMSRYGYRSSGFIDVESNFGAEAAGGMARGFDELQFVPLAQVGRAVQRWVARDRRPWLAWVHIRLAHLPYGAGPPFTTKIEPEVASWLAAVRAPMIDGSHDGVNDAFAGAMAANPVLRENLLALYDSGVHDADAQIGVVLDAVADRRATTIQVVLADHGDALGERGHFGHQDVVQPEVLRVPLVVRAPGIAPIRVPDTVSLVDVMPTLLELIGAVPPAGIDGRSLAAALRGGALPVKPVLAQAVIRAGKANTVRLLEVLVRPPWWLTVDDGDTTLLQLDPARGLVAPPSTDAALFSELEAARAAASAGSEFREVRPKLSMELKKALQKQGYW